MISKPQAPGDTRQEAEGSLLDPQHWGLPLDVVLKLGERLVTFWHQYRGCFKTLTRDGSHYAYHYLGALLRMDTERNFANIGRNTGVSGQNIQHFMSNSPWSTQEVFRQIQADIAVLPGLEKGGVLILDESADEKAGERSAGVARQYNGRLGKVDMSQVGVFLAYANFPQRVWTWVEGELFLPESWFAPEMATERQRLGIPEERTFATKVELGWQIIKRVLERGLLPFEAVACDTLYGQSGWFRAQLRQVEVTYMAEVPQNTQVYLNPPEVGIPQVPLGQRGRRPKRPRVLSAAKPLEVRDVARRADMTRRRVRVRHTERGVLEDEFAVRRVWTVYEGKPVEEWLVIRRESHGRTTYALSNAPADTPLEKLAWLKCQRYFGERAHQEAKSEMGWDELEAQKYRAWEHHLAMTILATWFVAQTKRDWAQEHPRYPALAKDFGVEVLPMLSVANVRTLLKAVMPLPQLTPEDAIALVIEHLVNRTRSRKSRMKSCHHSNAPP